MRLVVEALAADLGGIRTYVENLLRAWAATFPEDRLLVVVPPGSTLDTSGHQAYELRVPRPTSLGRPVAQTLHAGSTAREFGADAVLATLPSTSLRRTGIPTAVVVHDLRHEIRPEQFSRVKRLQRRISYNRAYAVADTLIAVSRRTLDDLHRLYPSTRGKPGHVVYHGADHVLSWPASDAVGPAVAFAHHTNKNPALLVRAWSDARARGLSLPPLLILGVASDARDSLAKLIDELDLSGEVTLAPYLSDELFRQAMVEAAAIILPSDLEGFGLPIVEGMALRKPVVIGPDAGATEIAGGHAAVMADWTPSALATAVTRGLGRSAALIDEAERWARGFTWERAVRETRSALLAAGADQRGAEGPPR